MLAWKKISPPFFCPAIITLNKLGNSQKEHIRAGFCVLGENHTQKQQSPFHSKPLPLLLQQDPLRSIVTPFPN